MNENVHKKKKIDFVKLLAVLLAAASVMLCISIYAFRNRESIAEKAAEQAAANVVVKTPDETTPAPTALPAELTALNSITYLVDKTHSLPADYVPSNLTTPYFNSAADAIQLQEECAKMAKEMKAAAEGAGINLLVTSGYIDYATQEDLRQAIVNLLGESKANTSVFKAGFSEHQTGLAIDFTHDPGVSHPNIEEFEASDCSKWLYEHAHEYGFILRYPKGKESITGYSYQPWHYRYVGKETASAIYAVAPDCTFEEYYGLNGTNTGTDSTAEAPAEDSTDTPAAEAGESASETQSDN